jgi:hypothetical protein
MKLQFGSILTAGLLCASPVFSATITLDFEGATSFASLNNFYNGGTDSAGASGANVGIAFGGDALALSNDALGPYYSNSPTPGTVLAPVGSDAALNSSAGFFGTASFYYSSAEAASVGIYSGLNGTGTLLGTFALLANAQTGCTDTAFCHWDLASLSFSGIAQSIQFGSAANIAGFDNVSVVPVPVPATLWLLISGLGGFGAFVRRKSAA